MAYSLKQIKKRIRGIENTSKITQAMELISAAKLNRVDKALFAMRPYFSRLESLMYELIDIPRQGPMHPFLQMRPDPKNICLCVITSDMGLCGTYNQLIVRLAQQFIDEHAKENIGLICIGKKGYNYFKRKQYNVLNAYLDLNGKYSIDSCDQIEKDLTERFICANTDVIYFVYAHYRSMLVHQPKIEKFLNLEPRQAKSRDYILEPDLESMLKQVLPKYISMKLRLIILEAFTAEQSARMIAMKTATDNARELLQDLIVLKNKVRQANITQEIMEIVSSSEALKG